MAEATRQNPLGQASGNPPGGARVVELARPVPPPLTRGAVLVPAQAEHIEGEPSRGTVHWGWGNLGTEGTGVGAPIR